MRKYLIILLFFAACSPAKRIERQQRQFDQIGRKWLEKNPCLVVKDSVIYVPGDTVVTEHVDTVYTELPVYVSGDTVYLPGHVKVVTRTVIKNIHDSVKVYVKDQGEINLCLSDLKKSEQDLSEMKIKEARGKKWVWISISLGLLALFLIYANIKRLWK